MFNESNNNIKLNMTQTGNIILKKWNLLNDEKKRRFESFSYYFVDKF
jgi:hypothetical protein